MGIPKTACPLVGSTKTIFIPAAATTVHDGGAFRPQAVAESTSFIWKAPDDLAVTSAINLYVLWSSSSTTITDTVTWRLLYTLLTVETTAGTEGATALSTALVADTNSATANCLQKTAAGVINANTITAGQYVAFRLDLNAVSGTSPSASDLIVALGVEIEYVQSKL